MTDAKALRAILRWSQADLAVFLGCNQATVHRMEAGQAASGAVVRLLTRLSVVVALGKVQDGMSVEDVVALAVGVGKPAFVSPQELGRDCHLDQLSLPRGSH